MNSGEFTASNGLAFDWDGKFEGVVSIYWGDGLTSHELLDVPVEDLMEFVAYLVRKQHIESLKEMTWEEILGVEQG